MGMSSHRCGWLLELIGGLQREPGRLPVGQGLGKLCVTAACSCVQMEDLELLISARILELKYSQAVPAIQGREDPAVQ